MSEQLSPLARRIGSRVGSVASERIGNMRCHPWALHIATLFPILPLIIGLVFGESEMALGSLGGILALQAGAWLIRRGRMAALEYAERSITKAPPPRKLAGAIMVGLAAFSLSYIADGQSLLLALVIAGLMGFASVLAYGRDPRGEKGLDPGLAERAGLRPEAVIAALEEARGKVRAIEIEANGIYSRELKQRLARITHSARSVLQQIERDPRDLRRARRFLVTYLDGTRDVVSGYRAQQRDLVDTPLADNFRHVLETVEKVFDEQQEVLKRNESLDLEVQIEVLKTQLEREGVH